MDGITFFTNPRNSALSFSVTDNPEHYPSQCASEQTECELHKQYPYDVFYGLLMTIE